MSRFDFNGFLHSHTSLVKLTRRGAGATAAMAGRGGKVDTSSREVTMSRGHYSVMGRGLERRYIEPAD